VIRLQETPKSQGIEKEKAKEILSTGILKTSAVTNAERLFCLFPRRRVQLSVEKERKERKKG
jgi:hypothetical protein